MANTRQSTKRARLEKKRQTRNQTIRSQTRTTLKNAVEAIQKLEAPKAKEAYEAAIRALAKAASKGSIPKGRASRKISRLTLLAKKVKPGVVPAVK